VAPHCDGAGAFKFRIPKRLDERSRVMLVATPADWARGTIRVIKCRLFPTSHFTKWEAFTRHANKSETHPHKVNFCDMCRDFFARDDSFGTAQQPQI
jgi:hypothetical protein